MGVQARLFSQSAPTGCLLARNIEASLTTDVDRSSFFVALVLVDVLAAFADAISGPLHCALSRRRLFR
jgi:hypothetical protein